MKKFLVLFTAVLLLLAGCSKGEGEVSDNANYDLSYSDRDMDASYDEKSAEKITLSDESITIDTEGTYILSGRLDDGQVIIDTPDDEKVHLVLDGISLSSSQSAPLLIKESDKVFITLAEGSTNSLTGPSSYSEEASEDNIDGVIFSRGDLCINGTGNLEITASSGHGIVSKDDFIVTEGNISITASGDGIQGKDCVKIKDGSISIDSQNDGIKSSNTETDYRGFVSIDGGKISIDAGYDGIQAATLLRVAGGDLDILTGGGSEYASTGDDWGTSWGGNKGNMGKQPDGFVDRPGGDASGSGPAFKENGGNPAEGDSSAKGNSSTEDSSSEDDGISAKGLKAGVDLVVSGGTLNVDSSDDSIHSNGDITIEDGSISVSSGDDGAHADSDLVIKGGNIDISKSYEGLEGNTVTVKNGNISIVASDDGLNAAGGSDSSSIDGRPGENAFAADESAYIEINGGELEISASGDGIDSNGSLEVTDGKITVTCPVSGDTSVLDYASDAVISGGTFIGTGAAQMAVSFSESKQGVIAVNAGSQSSSTVITIKDSDGKTILTHSPGNDFAVVIISSPDIVSGETYTIDIGSVSSQVTAE